jgi:hypothetical protein
LVDDVDRCYQLESLLEVVPPFDLDFPLNVLGYPLLKIFDANEIKIIKKIVYIEMISFCLVIILWIFIMIIRS